MAIFHRGHNPIRSCKVLSSDVYKILVEVETVPRFTASIQEEWKNDKDEN